MWVTQTYLKSPEPNAKLHVYYLFQAYNDQEVEQTERIQRALQRMGHRFGDDVALHMPSPESADSIENEVRELRPLWEAVYSKLPGVLICTKPMSDFRFEDGEHFFVSMSHPALAPNYADDLCKISRLIGEQLEFSHREMGSKEEPPQGPGRKFFDAVEMKPGIAGFRVDLKKLLKLN